MIHKFSMNGYNIVLDVDGGSVHILDDVAYELVDLYEENTKEEIISKLENKFTAEQIAEAYDEITSLKEEGLLEESDYSNVNFGENPEKIDINKEVREHILLFYNDFENKNINVEINLLNEEVFVEADKTALERVFTNLFQNTIKYSRGEFKISLEKTKHNVKIILINSIDELTEREVENLFDRFYMKDKTRSTSSSELGLTITKLLIEKMNGKIRAEIINGVLIFTIDYPILIV